MRQNTKRKSPQKQQLLPAARKILDDLVRKELSKTGTIKQLSAVEADQEVYELLRDIFAMKASCHTTSKERSKMFARRENKNKNKQQGTYRRPSSEVLYTVEDCIRMFWNSPPSPADYHHVRIKENPYQEESDA